MQAKLILSMHFFARAQAIIQVRYIYTKYILIRKLFSAAAAAVAVSGV